MVVKDIYGLKSDGESFNKQLDRNIRYRLGIKLRLYNPDTWMKPDVKASGFKYYEYIHTQVDDGMDIRNKCDNIFNILEETYEIGKVKGRFDEQ